MELANEALDALSRSVTEQDERTARFLSALAFFTASGFAALTIGEVKDSRFILPNDAIAPLPALYIGAFLAMTALAALYLILSIGPAESWATPYNERPSIYSFKQIAETRNERFEASLANSNSEELRRYQWEALMSTCHDAARRADYKYARIIEARAAFFLGVAPLGVGIVCTIEALGASGATATVDWSWRSAILAGMALGGVVFLSVDDRSQSEPATESPARITFRRLALCFGLHSGLVMISSMNSGGWGIGINVGAIAVLVPGAIAVSRWRAEREADLIATNERRVLDFLHPLIVIGLGFPQLGAAIAPAGRTYELLLAFLPLIPFEGVRLFDRFNWNRTSLGTRGWADPGSRSLWSSI
jgi:hypothetical protein